MKISVDLRKLSVKFFGFDSHSRWTLAIQHVGKVHSMGKRAPRVLSESRDQSFDEKVPGQLFVSIAPLSVPFGASDNFRRPKDTRMRCASALPAWDPDFAAFETRDKQRKFAQSDLLEADLETIDTTKREVSAF